MLTTVTVTLKLPCETAARLLDPDAAPYRRLTELGDAIRVGDVELVGVAGAPSPTAAELQSLLTPQEYRLAWTLQARRGQLVTYDALVCALWGDGEPSDTDIPTIRTHVKGIRAKLRSLGLDPWCIRVAKERGYLLVGDTDLLPPDAPRLAPMRAITTRIP